MTVTRWQDVDAGHEVQVMVDFTRQGFHDCGDYHHPPEYGDKRTVTGIYLDGDPVEPGTKWWDAWLPIAQEMVDGLDLDDPEPDERDHPDDC